MRIEKTARFLLELEQVLEFIAEDSFLQAQSFKNDLGLFRILCQHLVVPKIVS